MTTLEIIKAARELISDPKRWTQGASARDDTGSEHYGSDKVAVCWCATGAVSEVTKGLMFAKYVKAINLLDSVCPSVVDPDPDVPCLRPIAHYNDTHVHEEVLAKMDEAIELLSC
jgi:hypothetical protein